MMKRLAAAILLCVTSGSAFANGCERLPDLGNGVYYSADGRPETARHFGQSGLFYPERGTNHFWVQVRDRIDYDARGRFWLRSGTGGQEFISLGLEPRRPSDALAVTAYTRANLSMSPHFVRIFRRDVPANACPGQPEVQTGTDEDGRFIAESDYVLFHLGEQENAVLSGEFHFEFMGIRGDCISTTSPEREAGEPPTNEIFGVFAERNMPASRGGRTIANAPRELALILLPNPAMAERSGSETKAPVAGLSSSLHYLQQGREICVDIPAPLPTESTSGFWGAFSPLRQEREARALAERGDFRPTRTDFWVRRVAGSDTTGRITVQWR